MKNPRKYGKAPYTCAVIHGGPGALGQMAPVARKLSTIRGILEPFQTSSSVEGQVKELQTILKKHGELPITLIGHSWGAWLSYIFTSRYSSSVKKLILIGSGPFEEKYTQRITETRLSRLNEEEELTLYALEEALEDPLFKDKNKIFAEFGRLMLKTDSFDPLPFNSKELEYRYDIFKSVWEEARELRQSGRLLRLGRSISCPVVAIHGDYDPHPFEGVEKTLSQVLKDFRFILLKNCGHYPWAERKKKDRFYEILKKELS